MYGDTVKKDSVILATGPLHLFWTTGVYYLWELSTMYKIILVVDEIYKEDDDFKRVIELTNILEVVYVPYGENSIVKRHFCYAKKFKQLVKRHRPRIIFHHDAVYSSMMYLCYWARKERLGSLRISYLSGMSSSINFRKEFEAALDYNITCFINKHGLPKRFGRIMFNAKVWFKFMLDYYLLPLLFIKRIFSPPMNPSTFGILKNYWNNQFDFYLLYGNLDKRVAEKMFGSDQGIREIQHPLKTSGHELHKSLYSFSEENIALILPASSYLSTYQKQSKRTSKDLAATISLKWIQVISIMKKKFEDYSFIWKLHPVLKQDFLWREITDKVKEEYPGLVVLSADDNAQKLILRSKVVVSEVSSVLWWASFFRNKIAISFDVFGIPSMDFFKSYDGVYYFDNLKSFSETDFTDKDLCSSGMKGSSPTLSDFLSTIPVNK